MRLKLKRQTTGTSADDPKPLPRIAGGSPELDEMVLADTQYMDRRSAETIQRRVAAWSQLSPAELEACIRQI